MFPSHDHTPNPKPLAIPVKKGFSFLLNSLNIPISYPPQGLMLPKRRFPLLVTNAVVPAVPDLTTKVTISTSPAVVESVTVDAVATFAEVLAIDTPL